MFSVYIDRSFTSAINPCKCLIDQPPRRVLHRWSQSAGRDKHILSGIQELLQSMNLTDLALAVVFFVSLYSAENHAV